jgi:hypothetical protein
MGTEVAAVKQDQVGTAAGFEISGVDAVNIDKLLVLHGSSLRDHIDVAFRSA